MKRDHKDSCGGQNAGECSSNYKSKILWEEQQESGGGMDDELLAVLGYKVKSTEMADVAEKLQQLEMAMSCSSSRSQLSDVVHYNPADLSGWVHNMLSTTTNTFHQSRIYSDDSEYDLRAIPGVAAYPQPKTETSPKRLKTTSPTAPPLHSSSSSVETRQVVVVDSQETGVRLVHTLMACAEAVQQQNMKAADALVKQVSSLAASQSAGAMKKVATYFAEALARRIYRIHPADQDCLDRDVLQMHFYETCPYLKFAHFTANQALLEAFATADRVHVIDFGLKQGMQWPPLMQALARRPGGPPEFRLTGIGPPQPDNADALQEVGWKLAQLAESFGVKFEFRGFVVKSLADLEPAMLENRMGNVETVAVNSVLELHCLLARPGEIEKVLNSIKAMRPKIVTLVEVEANHNGPVFLDRFTESLHYYSSLFDSLEGTSSSLGPSQEDIVMSEVYLGRQICNVVACDGGDRVERHETLTQWRDRLGAAGFDSVRLGSNGFKQASMLLALYGGGDGYKVEENNGSLMLGWHTRPVIATSAWKLAGATQ